MKKILIATLVAFAGTASLEGCVTAHAYGQAVVTDAPSDNHLRIVIVPADPIPADKRNAASIVAEQHMATLFPQLVARLPVDFRHNGVDASATLLDVGSAVPPPADVRTLVIRPAQAWFIGSGGGSSLEMQVTLNDASRGVLWRGKIFMSSGTPASYGAAAVDRASIPLLEQLRDSKMIDISWRRPEIP